ncbi:MAG: SpoIIE family protein phosphatase [Clostridia bacterium]
MSHFIESGFTSINKFGEELCGDNVNSVTIGDYTTLVLADGLGSGVKANILSTLTSKILTTMVSNGIEMKDCMETIIESLPVCKERGVAYSTFSVIHINNQGNGYLFEFDNPEAVLMRDGKCVDLPFEQQRIFGRVINIARLNLSEDDVLLVMSDGTIHAGIGMLMNFGWEREEIKKYLEEMYKNTMSARAVSCLLCGACNDLYMDKPGDDTTVAAIKVRAPLEVSLMIGPPIDKEKDDFYINEFLRSDGKKIVCGGTSSQIVAKHLNKEVTTTFDFVDKDIPPIGYIDGIDLTTEGVLTMRKVLELSEKYMSTNDLTPKTYTKKDGASLIANMLFEEATKIRFFVGQSVNIAHQGLPIDTTMKLKLVEKLTQNLTAMGKEIEVNYD